MNLHIFSIYAFSMISEIVKIALGIVLAKILLDKMGRGL